MRFLISPAKTIKLTKNEHWNNGKPQYLNESIKLREKILKLSKKQMSNTFKIKGKLLDSTYENYHNNEILGHALMSYNGLVFKNLDITSLKQEEQLYLKDHVLILDALYGILQPHDLITFYRLDFNVKLGKNLYHFWDITAYFDKDDVLINLASNEYEKMLDGLPYITIDFKEQENGKYKRKATYAKMARGKFLRACATNQIKDIESLKTIAFDRYQYNHTISDENTFVYTRKS